MLLAAKAGVTDCPSAAAATAAAPTAKACRRLIDIVHVLASPSPSLPDSGPGANFNSARQVDDTAGDCRMAALPQASSLRPFVARIIFTLLKVITELSGFCATIFLLRSAQTASAFSCEECMYCLLQTALDLEADASYSDDEGAENKARRSRSEIPTSISDACCVLALASASGRRTGCRNRKGDRDATGRC